MKKRSFLIMLLVLSMLLGLLAGCGSSSSSSSSDDAEEAEEETVEETEEAEEEAEEAEEAEETETAAEGTGNATTATVISDPLEAMAEEYITYPLEGDDNVITIWYYIPGYVDYMDSNYNYNAVDDAEAATGVRLEFTEVSDSAATELFNLMVASGDMCDLIPVMEYYTGGLSKAYEEEIIIDLSEYVDEYMPNYAAVMECLDEQTVSDTLTDGKLLAFYQIADGSYSANGMATRGDWLEELGYEFSGDIISLEEFTELLELIHNTYETPYTIYMYDGTIGLEAAFDTEIPALVGDGFMTQVTSAIFRYGDTVTSGWITDGYREYLEWVIEMMDEGVLYSDFLSLDTDRQVVNTLTAAGDVAVWTGNADKLEEIAEMSDDENFVTQAMPRVAADPDAQYVWDDETALVSTASGFSVTTSCENPELVCMWQNYFWTTDGYMMANYGVEGESYTVDEDGNVDFTWENPVTVTGANAPNAEMAQNLFTMMRFVGFYADNDRLLPTFPDSALAAVDLWTLTEYGSTDDRNYPSILSNSLTSEESEEIAKYEGDFLTYADETALKFMTGALELNDDTWAEYIATCEEMGINEIIAVYQNAYDEYLAGER